MALVGHESAAMSHRYAHVGKEALSRAAHRFPESDRSSPLAMFDFPAHFCHAAPMETHAFGFQTPRQARRAEAISYQPTLRVLRTKFGEP
jgi:hypothetical protein